MRRLLVCLLIATLAWSPPAFGASDLRPAEGVLCGPAESIYACLDLLPLHAESSSPFADAQRDALEGQSPRSPGIGPLFSGGHPSDIAGLVVTIVIDPTEGVFCGWGGTEVGEEILEVVAPRRTHANPAPAVPRVALHAGIRAAPDHRIPGAPFLAATLSRGVTVLELNPRRDLGHPLAVVAAAAFRQAAPQRLQQDRAGGSAVAPATHPSVRVRYPARSRSDAEHRPSAVSGRDGLLHCPSVTEAA